MKKELSWYAGCEAGNDILIVGAGGTLRTHYEQIQKFIEKINPTIIGINKMTDFVLPHYHLWTNNQRLQDQKDCIIPESHVMLGQYIRESVRKDVTDDYIELRYVSAPWLKHSFRGGCLCGHFRNAGVLAIAVANVLNSGNGNIYIVGMDGFATHSEQDLKDGNESHHCYGKGFTDDATYEECIKKDALIYDGLQNLDKAGIYFKIITPTGYSKFYADIMGIMEC